VERGWRRALEPYLLEEGSSMKGLAALLTVAALLAPLACAEAQHFVVTVTTVDGKTMEGTVPEKEAAFEAVTTQGKTVSLRLERGGRDSKREFSEVVTRVNGGFVLRAEWYTAVMKSIWAELPLRVDDKVVKVAGKDVQSAKVKFVWPEKTQK
jgi:sulfur carrier protein ThiS